MAIKPSRRSQQDGGVYNGLPLPTGPPTEARVSSDEESAPATGCPPMDPSSGPMLDLTERLLVVEAATGQGDPRIPASLRICAKLRVSLIRIAGKDGFEALLRRALAQARRDVSDVATVSIRSDGSLDGAEALPDGGALAGRAIVRHLLELMVSLVGRTLTLRLLREAWPEVATDPFFQDESRS